MSIYDYSPLYYILSIIVQYYSIFIGFFFISSFKTHTQAQWVVPISIPLIVIPFNYLIDNQKDLKLFKILAIITLVISTFARLLMAVDGILPKQLEMHGNEKWVNNLNKEIGNKTPLFFNSYQNTSFYWFYSGERPYQLNAWDSRKNQYDLYNYNKEFSISNNLSLKVQIFLTLDVSISVPKGCLYNDIYFNS